MLIYHDLKELLEILITWEHKLTDFYDAAETGMKDTSCSGILEILRKNHEKNLLIMSDIHIEDYGKDKWIQWAPDYDFKHLLQLDVQANSCAIGDIIDSIMEFEEKMKSFYGSIAEKITTREEKELFESLVTFKGLQIYEIKRITEMY